MPPPSDDAARDEAVAERMRDPNASALEKGLAAVQGAAEGFAEQSRAGNFPALAGEAVDKVQQTVRGVRDAVRAERPAGATGPAADAPYASGYAVPSFAPAGDLGGGIGTASSMPPAERASEGARRAERYVAAVGESARRAAELPAAVRHEIRTTVREVAGDVGGAVAGFLTAVVFAFFAIGFLAVVAAVGLNAWLGAPMGTFLVGLFFAAAAAVIAGLAVHSLRAAREDAREGLDAVKAEARGVAAPLRGIRG